MVHLTQCSCAQLRHGACQLSSSAERVCWTRAMALVTTRAPGYRLDSTSGKGGCPKSIRRPATDRCVTCAGALVHQTRQLAARAIRATCSRAAIPPYSSDITSPHQQ